MKTTTKAETAKMVLAIDAVGDLPRRARGRALDQVGDTMRAAKVPASSFLWTMFNDACDAACDW